MSRLEVCVRVHVGRVCVCVCRKEVCMCVCVFVACASARCVSLDFHTLRAEAERIVERPSGHRRERRREVGRASDKHIPHQSCSVAESLNAS